MMVPTFTGPAVYTDAEKYQKIAFGDIASAGLSRLLPVN
mgnify:CR=1 FL=1